MSEDQYPDAWFYFFSVIIPILGLIVYLNERGRRPAVAGAGLSGFIFGLLLVLAIVAIASA